SVAFRRLVLVEGRKFQILDVESDAVAEGQHQNDRTDERERQPDGVAQQLHGFAPGISPQPPGIESSGRTRLDSLSCRCGCWCRRLRRLGFLCFVYSRRFLQIADEGVLE